MGGLGTVLNSRSLDRALKSIKRWMVIFKKQVLENWKVFLDLFYCLLGHPLSPCSLWVIRDLPSVPIHCSHGDFPQRGHFLAIISDLITVFGVSGIHFRCFPFCSSHDSERSLRQMPQLLEDHIHQTAPAVNAVNEGQRSLVAMVADNRLVLDYLLAS